MNTFHGKLVWSLASVALCVGLSLFPAHHLGAQVKDEKSTPDAASVRKPPASSPGPYCGVYSVYAALRSQGINVRFEDLLQPKYIGSEDGSSLSELQMAARDFGAEAFPLEGLTATSLRAARYPIILHVRRPGKDTPFLHWILFLGNEGNRAHIIDPPNSVETVSFAQLLSLWDGVGLVIAKEPHATRSMFLASWLEQGVVLLLIAVGLGAVRLVLARRNRFWKIKLMGVKKALIQGPLRFACLLTMACVLAGVWHLLSDEGFFRNQAAIAQVVSRHFEPSLPRLSLAAVEELMGRDEVTFIDARTPRAFAVGHLRSAINLPVFASLAERERILAGVKPAGTIVVYCQSEHCHWGKAVAADLYYRGFHNVALFPGGWKEWEQHERQ